jgi:hypothetical protein
LPTQSLYFTSKVIKKGQQTDLPNLATLDLEKLPRE